MVGWALQASKVGDLDEPDYLTVHPTPSRGKRQLTPTGRQPKQQIGWGMVS